MKNKLLVMLLLVGFTVMGGVPGYQGLRFSILYDAGIMQPTLVGRPGVIPMLYHNGTLDYVVARDLSVGITYGFMFYNAQPDRQSLQAADGYTTVNAADYKGKYTQHTVALQIKKFYRRKGYLAPVGRYFMAGAYYQYVIDNSTSFTSTETYTGYAVNAQGFRGVANFAGIMLGAGRTYVVANRMLIDFGCKLHFTPIIELNGSTPKGQVYRDLVLRNLFQIYLGLGVLAI